MRAIELRTYGDPSSGVHVIEAPEPAAPGAGDVLIGMEYAPVNLNDIYVMQGQFPVHPDLPSPIGNEGVGRVLAVGEDVIGLSVGDVVLLPLYSLTWRERLVVPSSEVIVVGGEIVDLQQLSMLRINAVTAALLLSQFYDLKPGNWIIQNAGNSAVARSVIAFAKSRGFRIINLVRRPEVIDEVIAAGADAAFLDEDGSLEQISDLVGDGSIRLALDGVGGRSSERLATALGPNGVLVSYGVLGGDVTASVGIIDIIFKNLSYQGFYVDKAEYSAMLPAIVSEAAQLVSSGKLHVPIAAVYSIEDVGRAIEHAQRGGKTLLKLGA